MKLWEYVQYAVRVTDDWQRQLARCLDDRDWDAAEVLLRRMRAFRWPEPGPED